MMDNDSDDSDDSQRGRGIITPADRDYLRLSEEEREEKYSQSARIQRRTAIAERIENALLDFSILARRLNDEIINDVFGPGRGDFVEFDGMELPAGEEMAKGQTGVSYGLEFLLRVARADAQHDKKLHSNFEESLEPFLSHLEHGIESWLHQKHQLIGNVDVSASTDDLQRADDFAEEIRSREELSLGEQIKITGKLDRAGYSDEEIADILSEVVGDNRRGE